MITQLPPELLAALERRYDELHAANPAWYPSLEQYIVEILKIAVYGQGYPWPGEEESK